MSERQELDRKIFGTPLPQQDLSPEQVAQIVSKKWGWEVKWNNLGNGFVTICPACSSHKLLYSERGKMFICLDYSGCGKRFMSFFKLNRELRKTKKAKQTTTD